MLHKNKNTFDLESANASDKLMTAGVRYSVGEEASYLPIDSDQPEDDTCVEREKYSNKLEYLLTMIGYAVGLGNLYRFPYVCIRNGGGAFLVPFFICLVFMALPIFVFEVSLGQFTSRGPLHVWGICPLFQGIGISMCILCALVSWYYQMLIAWTLIYLANSIKSPQPWTLCGQSWNTDLCTVRQSIGSRDEPHITNDSSLGNDTEFFNETFVKNSSLSNKTYILSTVEFWRNNVLEISDGFENLDGIPWHTCVALFVGIVIIWITIFRGVHSSGKIVYVTAVLPYILIGVLLVRGAMLPGASDGILFYITPKWEKLVKLQTWIEAALQVFYSLGPAWGGLITMASYNKFHGNCVRECIFITFLCEGTSVFGGFAIFTILGHMADRIGTSVESFAKTGAGLVFVVYPEGISYLPLPQLWGILFFLMVLTLGLDSQFVNFEAIITTLVDIWPRFLRKWRAVFTAAYLLLFFLISLVFAARGGIYVFQIVDWYISVFALLVNAILECFIVGWIYGSHNFNRDISMMTGRDTSLFFAFMWRIVSPLLIFILLVCTLLTYTPPTLGDYVFGSGARFFGWCIAISGFLPLPVTAFYVLYKARGNSFTERLISSIKPTNNYGPADPKLKAMYKLSMQDFKPLEISVRSFLHRS